jgi:N-acetyl-anhydromuramoyl-L-alanine amidase
MQWLNLPRCPSPNHNARPAGAVVDTVVVHNISLPPADFRPKWVRALFQNRLPWDAHPYFKTIEGIRVSAHFYIQRNGRTVQCVPLHRRAWHAGVSSWAGRTNLNDTSVGIELAGDDCTPFTQAQYAALARLIQSLAKDLPLRYVVGHSDIAPGRKTDPGAFFDWASLKAKLPLQLNLLFP